MGGINLIAVSPVAAVTLVLLVWAYLLLKKRAPEKLYISLLFSGAVILAAFYLPIFIFLTIVPVFVYAGNSAANMIGPDRRTASLFVGACVGVAGTSLAVFVFGDMVREIDNSATFIVVLVVAGLVSSLYGTCMGAKENTKTDDGVL